MGRKWAPKKVFKNILREFFTSAALSNLFDYGDVAEILWVFWFSVQSIISRLEWWFMKIFYFKFNEVFSVVEFETIWLFTKLVVFFDRIPNVIAIGVMIAIVMKKIQSPARIKGLWRSRFSAIFKRSSLVSALLWRFLVVGSLFVSQTIQLSFSGSP